MGAQFRIYRRVLAYALPQWRTLAAIVGLSVLVAATTALAPWPLKFLVDQGLRGDAIPVPLQSLLSPNGWEPSRLALVAYAAVASIAIFAAFELLDAALTMAWSKAGQRMVYGLAGDLFLQLQRLSLLFHARRSVGDSLSRVTGDAWCVYKVTDALLIVPARQ